jgi:hypothetical protein
LDEVEKTKASDEVNGGKAHHIQVVVKTSTDEIWIYQGNSGWSIHKPFSYFFDLVGENPANPSNRAYAGLPIEIGCYRKSGLEYNYKNNSTGATHTNFLSASDWLSWNFMEFNN